MTLIKSIAGFRGTIGGETGDTLNPLDIVKSVTAFAMLRRPLVGQYENKIVFMNELNAVSKAASNIRILTLKNGEILVLENTRFEDLNDKAESKNSVELARF